MRELNDEILLSRLLTDNAEAFEEIYRRFVKTLYNYAYRLCQDKQKAEDAVQDTFIELWSKRAHCGKILNIKAYLITCVRRKINRTYNAQSSFPISDNENFVEKFFSEFPIEEVIITQENYRRVISFLQSQIELLPKREFEALHLRFYENLGFEEIAQIMEISPQSARNTVGKGIVKLRQNLPKSLLFSAMALLSFYFVK